MAERAGRVPRELDRWWFSSAGVTLRTAVQQTTDLLAPTWCVGCGASGADLCQECREDLRLLMRRPFHAESGALALPIVDADRTGIQVLPVISAASYRTLVADVVVAFKDHARVRLSGVLAPALAEALQLAAQEVLIGTEALLLWPPASRRAQLKRGRSPVRELVDEAAHRGLVPPGCEPAGHLLRHTGGILEALPGRHGQKGRTKDSRRRTASQFSVPPQAQRRLRGSQVILVDDVLTTGATLHRLYAAVSAAGAAVRGAVVLAATPQAESA